MPINSPHEELPWNSEDTTAWRNFLDTRAGSRLVPKLLETLPQLLAGGAVNEILIRAGETRGFSAAARTLLSLAYPEPVTVAPTASAGYPDLENDEIWNDGQKTNAT